MKKVLTILTLIILAGTTFTFSGCAKGENDPFFTLHSRDARLTQKWKLVSFNGTRVQTIDSVETNVEYTFDGTNLYTTTNGVTTSVNYIFTMEIKANGEVFSQEFQNNASNVTEPISQSSKTSFWYWGDDDKTKTAVYLDLTGLYSDILVYDIPRLAWNDMTLSVSYSDNYTPVGESPSSLNVNYELNFEVNLVP